MATLYCINEQLQMVIDEAERQAEENEGLIDDSLYDNIDALELEKGLKILDLGRLIKNIQSDVDGMRAEEIKLSNRRKKLEGRVAAIENYILGNMAVKEKYSDLNTVVRVGESEYVDIIDEDAIPFDLVKIERKPKKAEIKKYIKSLPEGEIFPAAAILKRKNLSVK